MYLVHHRVACDVCGNTRGSKADSQNVAVVCELGVARKLLSTVSTGADMWRHSRQWALQAGKYRTFCQTDLLLGACVAHFWAGRLPGFVRSSAPQIASCVAQGSSRKCQKLRVNQVHLIYTCSLLACQLHGVHAHGRGGSPGYPPQFTEVLLVRCAHTSGSA
jgi:hypothetical protein